MFSIPTIGANSAMLGDVHRKFCRSVSIGRALFHPMPEQAYLRENLAFSKSEFCQIATQTDHQLWKRDNRCSDVNAGQRITTSPLAAANVQAFDEPIFPTLPSYLR
jgi:hypothetical protein